MKLLLLAFGLSVASYAQCPSGTVQIADTLYALGTATPTLMQGTIDLTITYSTAGTSGPVVQSSARLTIVNGALSYCAPAGANITAVYTVKRPSPLTGNVIFTRYWGIPASGGPYKLLDDNVERLAMVATPVAPGNYCLETVNGIFGWIPHVCGTGILFDDVPGLFDSRSGLIDSQ